MTHDELLTRLFVTDKTNMTIEVIKWQLALRAVVELHKRTPLDEQGDVCLNCCTDCLTFYPCPTIQAIERELK